MRKITSVYLVLLLWALLLEPFSAAKDTLFFSECENQLSDIAGLVQSIQELAQSNPELASALYDPLRVLQTEPEQLSSSELSVRTLYEKIWQQLSADSQKLLLSALSERGSQLTIQSSAWNSQLKAQSGYRIYKSNPLPQLSMPQGKLSRHFLDSKWVYYDDENLYVYNLDKRVPGSDIYASDMFWLKVEECFLDLPKKKLLCISVKNTVLTGVVGIHQELLFNIFDFSMGSVSTSSYTVSSTTIECMISSEQANSIWGLFKQNIDLPSNFSKTLKWEPSTHSLYSDINTFRIFFDRGSLHFLITQKPGSLKTLWKNFQSKIKNYRANKNQPPLPDCIRSFISNDGRYLVCQDLEEISFGLSLKFIRLKDRKVLNATDLLFGDGFQQIQDFVLSPDFRYLIVAGTKINEGPDGGVYLFDISDQNLAEKLWAQ